MPNKHLGLMGDQHSKAIVEADINSRQLHKQLKDARSKYQEEQKKIKDKEEQMRRDHDMEMKRLEEKIMAKSYQEFLKMRDQNEEYQKKQLAILKKEHEERLKEQERVIRTEIGELKSEEITRQNARADELQQV